MILRHIQSTEDEGSGIQVYIDKVLLSQWRQVVHPVL